MKKYIYDTIYRGQQITKMCCANNAKEAAKKLEISIYNINKYCRKVKIENKFDGVIALFDSGYLWRERKDLIRKEIPLFELISIIDNYKDKEYEKFKISIGIKQ